MRDREIEQRRVVELLSGIRQRIAEGDVDRHGYSRALEIGCRLESGRRRIPFPRGSLWQLTHRRRTQGRRILQFA